MELEKSRALRRANTQNFIKKQLGIAKQNGRTVKEPGRLKKRHLEDCGNPQCGVCSNPRRNPCEKKKQTIQEMRQQAAYGRIELAALVSKE